MELLRQVFSSLVRSAATGRRLGGCLILIYENCAPISTECKIKTTPKMVMLFGNELQRQTNRGHPRARAFSMSTYVNFIMTAVPSHEVMRTEVVVLPVTYDVPRLHQSFGEAIYIPVLFRWAAGT